MKYRISPFLFLAILISSCQEGSTKTGENATNNDTVMTGLEGTRDQSGQTTDVKLDTSYGRSEKVSTVGHGADSINQINAGSGDRQFVSDAVNGNTEEIGMAKLAKGQSTNADIKKVANELEKDHSAALKELNALSSKKKFDIASTPLSPSDNMSGLKSAKGKEFDKAWCSLMIEKHKATIAKYESSEKTVSDKQLKEWISKTLPKLRMHNDHLMEIHGKL